MLVLAGAIAIGSAIWGAIAACSLLAANLIPAVLLLVGTATTFRWRLHVAHSLDLRPAAATEPIVML